VADLGTFAMQGSQGLVLAQLAPQRDLFIPAGNGLFVKVAWAAWPPVVESHPRLYATKM
jgi:hypothetical protein